MPGSVALPCGKAFVLPWDHIKRCAMEKKDKKTKWKDVRDWFRILFGRGFIAKFAFAILILFVIVALAETVAHCLAESVSAQIVRYFVGEFGLVGTGLI